MSPRTTFAFVYVALLGLLGATIGVAHLQLGPWNPVLNISIAAIKAFLIAWFFMHVREGTALVRLAAFGGLLWLGILFGLSMTDWLARPGQPLY
jgi:cytochrome c oxidase subunit IV